jgi:uncharacterized membrane protein (DUF4010 family)
MTLISADSNVLVIGEKLLPFAVSLFIGLAVGIDRERRNPEGEGTMGIRTITIVGLSGTVAGQIGSSGLTAGMILLITIVTALGYHRKTRNHSPKDIGLTTEVTVGLVFALGYLSVSDRLLAAIIGVVLSTILYTRSYLHTFTRETLHSSDITAALTLAVYSFVVLPLLPNKFLDPWNIFNLQHLGQIILLIGGVEFGGYIIERLFGPKIGSMATGFLGGLVSSTAIFLNMAKLSRQNSDKVFAAVATSSLATVATLILFVGIVGFTSPDLFIPVGFPATASAFVMCGFGIFASRHAQKVSVPRSINDSPLDIHGILKLSLFIVSLLALTATVKKLLGPTAVEASSFVSGLFELHATAFAAATLSIAGELGRVNAIRALLFAASASLISKLVISWAVGFGRFAVIMSVAICLAGMAGVGVFVLLTSFEFAR